MFLLFSMRLSFQVPLRSRGLRLPRISSPLSLSLSTRPAFHPVTLSPFRILPSQPRRLFAMNAQELSQYLADAPPSVVRLEIEKHFTALSDKQKRYAHFISR